MWNQTLSRTYYFKFHSELTGFLFMKHFYKWQPTLDFSCIHLVTNKANNCNNKISSNLVIEFEDQANIESGAAIDLAEVAGDTFAAKTMHDQRRIYSSEMTESQISRLPLKSRLKDNPKQTIRHCLLELVSEALEVISRDGDLVFKFKSEAVLVNFIKNRFTEDCDTLEKVLIKKTCSADSNPLEMIVKLPEMFEITRDNYGEFTFVVLSADTNDEFWKLFEDFRLAVAEGEYSAPRMCRYSFFKFRNKLTGFLFMKQFCKWIPHLSYQCIDLIDAKVASNSNTVKKVETVLVTKVKSGKIEKFCIKNYLGYQFNFFLFPAFAFRPSNRLFTKY